MRKAESKISFDWAFSLISHNTILKCIGQFQVCSVACLGVPLREAQKLPGKAFVILCAGPGVFGFLERLSPFVRFLRLRNLIKHLIVSGAVIASAKDTRDQDKANKERTGHKIFDPNIVQMQRKQEILRSYTACPPVKQHVVQLRFTNDFANLER